MMQVGQNLVYSRERRLPSVARPICLDTVAIDFPELKLLGIHIGIPWADEMIAMASKHENVFIGIDSTEAGIVCNPRPRDQLRKQQCVGQPFMMNQVKLLGKDGATLKRGAVGELFSTSPCLFLDYCDNPDATAASTRDGWFSAGDLAWQDDDGCYYIVDRKKDLYISGGVNVYPRETDELLVRLPGVREAAVVGIADEYWGETGKAFLVLEPGATISPETVIAACKERLAGYKAPRHVAYTDSLPRNDAGKVLKTELRSRA